MTPRSPRESSVSSRSWGAGGHVLADYVLPASAVLVGLLALACLRGVREQAPAGRRAVAWAVGALLVAMGAATPWVNDRAVRTLGMPNVGELVTRTCLMVAGLSAQVIFVDASSRPSPRARIGARIGLMLAAVGAVWTSFAVASPHPTTPDFYVLYARDPAVTSMLVVSLAYLAWSFTDVVVGWARLASAVTGTVRSGLRLMALGAVAGLLYVAVRAVGQVLALTGATSPALATVPPGTAVSSLAALLVVIGVLWPSAHYRFAQLRRWWTARRLDGHLLPLWRDVAATWPHLALEPPAEGRARRAAQRLRLRHVHWRLYRRVIEIRDARLVMARALPLARRRARQRLQRLDRRPEAATVEGWAMADLLPGAPGDTPMAPEAGPVSSGDDGELAAAESPPRPASVVSLELDAQELVAVSDAYVEARRHGEPVLDPPTTGDA